MVRERVFEQQPLIREILHAAQIAGASGQLDGVKIGDESPTRAPVLDPPDVLSSHGVRLTYIVYFSRQAPTEAPVRRGASQNQRWRGLRSPGYPEAMRRFGGLIASIGTMSFVLAAGISTAGDALYEIKKTEPKVAVGATGHRQPDDHGQGGLARQRRSADHRRAHGARRASRWPRRS